ncbi:metalloregulator ArsR/SmtB family transcription factor [Marinitoga sp. 38H-ov]|uniref:ArsR/SmtB family transcription factor n=1 Tax=Marinitoga sp. 38H-ov TaxID=1755814 RepID=UPI0013EA449D|nr:metalloregulator ArsR/SmtB family transcription factor [Marinitoga sp. 38H-ov]KAF2956249.1 ArsR family transcriptional regulator [Marinitoga sp. 38H-ov]
MKKKKNIEICQTIEVHEDIIRKVQENTPNEEILNNLSELFKIIGDKTRMKILYTLMQVDEICVCDISAVLNMSISAISHQLRILRQSNLVKFRKTGKVVYYSLNDNHVKELIEIGYIHVNE